MRAVLLVLLGGLLVGAPALLAACGGSQPQPTAVASLAPLVCQSALLQSKFTPADAARICADSELATRLSTELTEVVVKAVQEAQKSKADAGTAATNDGGASGAVP